MVDQPWDKGHPSSRSGVAIGKISDTSDPSSLSPEETEKLEEELRTKNIQKLMELSAERQKEADQAARVLHSVKSDDMSALTPYITHTDRPSVAIRTEDDEKAEAIIAEKHLRNERVAIEVKPGEDPAHVLETQKQWVKYLLPNLQTEAVLIKSEDGKTFVGMLGVSNDELDAAYKVRGNQERSKEESRIITKNLQEKLNGEVQKSAAPASEQTVTALATPGVERESPGVTPAHRG